MNLIKDDYWTDTTFNNSEVRVSVQPCKEKETPYDDYKVVHKVREV